MREFVSTFNRSELDEFVELLDPEVEIHGMKGLFKGRDQARKWATKTPGGVQQTVLIEHFESTGSRVMIDVKREWRWEDGGELAFVDELSWIFEMKEGKVASWRPFQDRVEARSAFEG